MTALLLLSHKEESWKVEHPKRNKQRQVAFIFFLSTSYSLLAHGKERKTSKSSRLPDMEAGHMIL
jgi:hypothetical protein